MKTLIVIGLAAVGFGLFASVLTFGAIGLNAITSTLPEIQRVTIRFVVFCAGLMIATIGILAFNPLCGGEK